ncbi:transposase, partial [Staphylococcus aureus]
MPQNDISRYVNEIVETIPDSEFDEFRHHRGATSYHPKMMLKIILYAYTQSVFSGRRIEKLLHDSIRMMWLAQEYIVADAGYGSEQNYMAIIDDFNKTPLITYGMFIKDKTRKFKSDIFNTQNWKYDELNDEFICPN